MTKQRLKITWVIAIFLLVAVAILPFSSLNGENLTAHAMAGQSSENRSIFSEKIYSTATLEDNFCDNSIIVVLDENASSFSAIDNTRRLNTNNIVMIFGG